ncbi:MAG TPA: hypothetical protein PKC25_03720, partial [Candidatus Rifleibacterium sp.]|nr:hypothetical protein [Candidatus Rifleibacterium sp.]
MITNGQNQESLVACRFCRSEIPVSALKCRHCREWLGDRSENQANMAAERVGDDTATGEASL